MVFVSGCEARPVRCSSWELPAGRSPGCFTHPCTRGCGTPGSRPRALGTQSRRGPPLCTACSAAGCHWSRSPSTGSTGSTPATVRPLPRRPRKRWTQQSYHRSQAGACSPSGWAQPGLFWQSITDTNTMSCFKLIQNCFPFSSSKEHPISSKCTLILKRRNYNFRHVQCEGLN